MQQRTQCDAERLSELFALPASVWIDEELHEPDTQEFGFSGIGDGWTKESVIFKPVKELFPDEEVLHHHWSACPLSECWGQAQ